jgi:hypothetical protein
MRSFIAISVELLPGFGARGLLTGRLQTASALTFLNFFFCKMLAN